jgi:glutamate racemase
VVLISSADVTAAEVYAGLRDGGLLSRSDAPGTHRFIASSEGIFSELGARFLGPEFGRVEHRPWDRA